MFAFHTNIVLVMNVFQLLMLFVDTLIYADNKSFVVIMFYITFGTSLSLKLLFNGSIAANKSAYKHCLLIFKLASAKIFKLIIFYYFCSCTQPREYN